MKSNEANGQFRNNHYICDVQLNKPKTMGRFINPFTDWGFKRIFGQEINKDLLIQFLNELLAGERHITELHFLDKEQLPETKDQRGAIYDIFCKTDTGEQIIVEIQNRRQPFFMDRSIFYASRAVVGQGQKGEAWDYKLSAVYTICFMNFHLSEAPLKKFRMDVGLMDMQELKPVSDKFRLIYLMLPLFPKKEEAECENDFERWIYVLTNMETLERMPFQAQNEVFKKLAAITDVSTLSSKERERYDESLKIYRDNYAADLYSYNRGIKKGREEGRAKGREEGLSEGRVMIARNMKACGVEIPTIIRCTGLTQEEIDKL